MRAFYLFLSNFCKNCVYYNPAPNDFTLEKSICLKFDHKFVDMCREDETKCGESGKHFKQKSNETNQQDIKLVSCKNCKHYEPSFNRCTAFKKPNIITGINVYDYIELCRHDETKCGKTGKFYTPK